jgi:beta-lactamase superfamily II metal-dependent hydrolase
MTTVKMVLRIFDVEHGACTMLAGPNDAIAMIDCGHNSTTGWRPSVFLRKKIGRSYLDYLLITNADEDHLSDLSTLRESGVDVRHLITNTWVPPATLRWMKQQSGPVSSDAEALLQMRSAFGPPGSGIPFDQGLGGVTVRSFCHTFPTFSNTNDLSCVFFISFGPFKILFPGDLEKPGWKAHLQNPTFIAELRATTILVASHHGRENGFCEEAFQFLQPQAVVMSDKSIVHGTQEMVPQYRGRVRGDGIRLTNEPEPRHVLTTRCDGDILFQVEDNGNYLVTTAVQ